MQQRLWIDIKAVLDKFVEHMEDDIVQHFASNCLNKGYTYPQKGNRPIVANVGDRIMCTLMTGASYFLNGWSSKSASWEDHSSNKKELEQYIRCAVANIFMYILNESPCKSDMGVYYAWHTVKKMEAHMGGLLTQRKCRKGLFADIQIEEFDMQTQITTWSENNKRLTDKIGGQGIDSTCRKSLAELDGATQGIYPMHGQIELQPQEKTLIQTLGQDLKLIVEEVKTEVVQCAQANGACIESIQDVSSSDLEDNDTEATAPNSVAGGTPAPPLGSGPQPSTPDPPTPANTTPEKPNKGPV
ncbi:hypothetical protein AK88_05489, partial [Plasmodium fragile]